VETGSSSRAIAVQASKCPCLIATSTCRREIRVPANYNLRVMLSNIAKVCLIWSIGLSVGKLGSAARVDKRENK
jgi:hypothetical protein